jgi:hypothetical protein
LGKICYNDIRNTDAPFYDNVGCIALVATTFEKRKLSFCFFQKLERND